MAEEFDAFSEKVASEIHDVFPEWCDFMRIDEWKGEKALVIEVPGPTGIADAKLRLDTFRGEITLYYRSMHSHFDELQEPDAPMDALRQIEEILREEVVVYAYYRDDEWCGSGFCTPEDAPRNNADIPYANRILVHSWNGTYDRETLCIPKG